MTRRDVVMLCNFTLRLRHGREIAQPYRFWGLLGFPPRSEGMGSLAVLVEVQLKLNPFAEAVFVFSNRRFNAIKLLYWERNGFCLWQKRLEKDRFIWPKAHSGGVVPLTAQQLEWLLAGFDINRMKPHQALKFHSVL